MAVPAMTERGGAALRLHGRDARAIGTFTNFKSEIQHSYCFGAASD